jgi:hypothetical protein
MTAPTPRPPAARAHGASFVPAGESVIDELLVADDRSDLGHESIEIAKVTSKALDLAALRVADQANRA